MCKQPVLPPIVLLGPSGGGKTEVAKLLVRDALFKRVITCTTRKPRVGEVNGVHYHFLSRHEFARHVFNGDFIEYDTSRSEMYGTLSEDISAAMNSSEVPLLVMNLVGATEVRKAFPGTIVFFIAVPLDQLVARLRLREDTEQARNERIAGLREELRAVLHPCVSFIINNEDGRLEEAADIICLKVEQKIGRLLMRL